MELRLAVIGDLHYSAMPDAALQVREARDEFYGRLFNHFFSVDADMHIALGDVTHEGHLGEWQGIRRFVDEYGTARNRDFRFILGNHDSLAGPKAQCLTAMAGAPRYSLHETEVCRLVFLDTTKESLRHDWGGVIDEEQVTWLGTMKDLPPKPTLVFGHHPFPRTTSNSHEPMMFVENSDVIQEALAPIAETVVYFNGHNHIHSIAASDNALQNWLFVQSACALSAFSFRTVEVTETKITVSSVNLPQEEFSDLSDEVRSAMTDFMHHPFARGGQRDQTVVVDLSISAPSLR